MLHWVSKPQHSLGISNLIQTLLNKYITTAPSDCAICICHHTIHEKSILISGADEKLGILYSKKLPYDNSQAVSCCIKEI